MFEQTTGFDSCEVIQDHIRQHRNLLDVIEPCLLSSIPIVADVMVKSLTQNGTIFWCGNGGSASDSQHLAAELVGRFKDNREPLRAISLAADVSVLTCISNDFSYDDVFARQILGLARRGDVLVAMSTSGNSPNICRAVDAAKAVGVTTVGILGRDGGHALKAVDHFVLIQDESTARIQEIHIMVGHILCDLIEYRLGFRSLES